MMPTRKQFYGTLLFIALPISVPVLLETLFWVMGEQPFRPEILIEIYIRSALMLPRLMVFVAVMMGLISAIIVLSRWISGDESK
jgi:hypothetical protein